MGKFQYIQYLKSRGTAIIENNIEVPEEIKNSSTI